MWHVRDAAAAEFDAVGALMVRSVLAAPSPYPPAHRRAWAAAGPRAGPVWAARLAGQAVVVEDGLRGVMTVGRDGAVDLAFVAPEARGAGLFRALHAAMLARAPAGPLSTFASLAAEGPFRACGWRVTEREVVEIAGLSFRRAAMVRAAP